MELCWVHFAWFWCLSCSLLRHLLSVLFGFCTVTCPLLLKMPNIHLNLWCGNFHNAQFPQQEIRYLIQWYFLHFSTGIYKISKNSKISVLRIEAVTSEVYNKNVDSKYVAKFTGKQLCRALFFNKVAGSRPVTLLKRGSGAEVFLWILQNF